MNNKNHQIYRNSFRSDQINRNSSHSGQLESLGKNLDTLSTAVPA